MRNLLDFSRQREPSLKAVDVNACLDEALSLLRNQVALQGIALETRLAGVPAVQADFGQLRQALVNVILNACEAMPGGGSLAVSTRFDCLTLPRRSGMIPEQSHPRCGGAGPLGWTLAVRG